MIDVDAGRLRATGRCHVSIARAALDPAPDLRQAIERLVGRPLEGGRLDADLDPETTAAVRDAVQMHCAGGSLAPACVPFHCFEAIRDLVRSGQLVLTVEVAPIRSGSNAILRALLHHPDVAAVAKNLARRFAAGSDRFWGSILGLYAAHRHASAPLRIVYKDHWIAMPPILESQLLQVAGELLLVVRDPLKVAFSVAHAFTAADELLASIVVARLPAAATGVVELLAGYARDAGFADWPALQAHAARHLDYRPLEALFHRMGFDDDAAHPLAEGETGDHFARRHPAAFLATWSRLARLAEPTAGPPRAAVVDMTRLQLAPAETLRHLCRRLSLPYADAMRGGWQASLPGPALRDAVLTRDVDASTGIRPPLRPTPPFDHLPRSLHGFVERAMPVYLELVQRARTPDDDAAMERCIAADGDAVRCNPLPFYAHLSTTPRSGDDRRAARDALRRTRPDLRGLFDRIDAWAGTV